MSIRKAGEPADADHLYGHEKMENLAAATEAALILVGAGIITYEAVARLLRGAHVHTVGVGIAVIGASAAVNLVVSRVIARRARESRSVALEGDAAHLSADAISSVAVLIGLVLIAVTHAYWLDPVVALIVAAGILVAGLRLLKRASRALVDEALPEADLALIRDTIRELGVSLFMACVGIYAGKTFVATVLNGDGLLWMASATLITFLPIFLVGLLARAVFKTNYLTLCGVLAGSMTDPPALAFATGLSPSQAQSTGYAAVYPLVMFLRILSPQIILGLLWTVAP